MPAGSAIAAASAFGPIGLGIGAAVDIGKILFGISQNSKANKINPVFNQYQTSPYAKAQLGIAQQLFNAPMAGVQTETQNIQANQANTNAAVQRNATDSGQALAIAAQTQGQSNDAYSNLQLKEEQDKLAKVNLLNQGYDAMTNEGDKVYKSMLDKFQIDKQEQAGLRGSAWQNIFGGASDLSAGFIKAGDKYGPGGSIDKNKSNQSLLDKIAEKLGIKNE